jgi:3-oxoisoapionate kinase
MSLLLAYYGDDFTGSTDALEALAAGGARTVLFLGVPSAEHLASFRDYEAVGIAGESRSQGPEWMREHLPSVFRFLQSLNPELTQYKVCSTFDSSPEVGSIGTAIEIGKEVFGSEYVPVVVAAPHLRRYVIFGNLFAAQGGTVYRIDRHPTMNRHPVTPMGESDLRLHLGEQTSEPVGLLDFLSLTASNSEEALNGLKQKVIIFDGFDERTERATGCLLWERRKWNPFIVGSSGLTYALIRHWHDSNPTFEPAAKIDRVIVVSGSCSPVTEAQIQNALNDGFAGLSLDCPDLLMRALNYLSRGKSVVIYSALGVRQISGELAGDDLGRHLGKLLRELVTRSGVRRAVIAGGDTASHAASQLGVHALTFAARLAPGAPLCRAHSDEAAMNGLELVLKGGQVGDAHFFTQVMKGNG